MSDSLKGSKKLIAKWTKSPLFYGLSEARKRTLALLLENQANWTKKR